MKEKIVNVTLYTASCEIERELEIPVNEGLTEYFYQGLVNEEVVYAESMDVEICEFKTKRALLDGVEERKKPLIDKVEQTKSRILQLSKEMARLQLGRDITLKNSDFESETVEEFERMYTYFLAKLDNILSELTEKQHESDELKKQLPVMEAEVKAAEIMKDCVCLTLRSLKKQTAKIKIVTKSDKAYFKPSYRVEVAENCMFKLVADIVNMTGRDWNNVYLDLCTAPNEFTTVPEFFPEHVGQENFGRARFAAAPMGYQIEESVQGVNAPIAAESVTSRDFSVESYSIKDGGTDKITLEEEELEFKLERIVFGFNRSKVLVVATCDYAAGIDANADVYYYGKLVSSTYLTSNTDEMRISLGVDHLISVSKKNTVPFTGGMLSKKTEKGYSITIKNNRDSKTEIFVVDRIPVSVNKTVIVEPVDLSGATLSADGRLDWKITLKPNEVKEIRVKYLIKK